MLLAGNAAEAHFTGRNNRIGSSQDFETVVDASSYFYHGRVLEKFLAFKVEYVRDLISAPLVWIEVEAVAEALLAHRTLKSKDVRRLVRGAAVTRAKRLEELDREILAREEAERVRQLPSRIKPIAPVVPIIQ